MSNPSPPRRRTPPTSGPPTSEPPTSKPRSAAQAAASRRNGAKSRGPVTDDGKQRAARNALRHGLTAARLVVLADENEAAFRAARAAFVADWSPRGITELALVEEAAEAWWQLRRARRLEVELWAALRRDDRDLAYAFLADLERSGGFEGLRRYRAEARLGFDRALRRLAQCRHDRPDGGAELAPSVAALLAVEEPAPPPTTPGLATADDLAARAAAALATEAVVPDLPPEEPEPEPDWTPPLTPDGTLDLAVALARPLEPEMLERCTNAALIPLVIRLENDPPAPWITRKLGAAWKVRHSEIRWLGLERGLIVDDDDEEEDEEDVAAREAAEDREATLRATRALAAMGLTPNDLRNEPGGRG